MLVKFTNMEDNKKKIDDKLDEFLEEKPQEVENQDVTQDVEETKRIITNDKSIVERINKKVITEDGRELLI